MAQPVKKVILEKHADLIKDEPFYTLLVDGGSLLFHSFSDDKKNSEGKHYGAIFQFLLQIRMQMQKRNFRYVYVFFDDEYSGKLRYDLYKPYKANRDKHYEDYGLSDYARELNANIKSMQRYLFNKNKPKKELKNDWDKFLDANFDRERNILMEMFEEIYIRCYMDEITEGDDLIAYYCKHRKPNEKIVIMSGDMDITQLVCDDIIVYNLKKKVYLSSTNFAKYFGYHPSNTLIKKIFTGDVSDNIGNIKGLSEEGFFKLMPEAKTRPITVNEVIERAKTLISERKEQKKKPLQLHENIVNGVSNKTYEGDFYEINKKIIDLSEPIVSKEAQDTMESMMYAPMDTEGRSMTNLYAIVKRENMEEIAGETRFANFFNIFKRLETFEKNESN